MSATADTTPDREHVPVRSVAELHDWLLAHHEQDRAVWLVTWKKAEPASYVPHEQVLDELVAFGWIDGVRHRVDEHRTVLRWIAMARTPATRATRIALTCSEAQQGRRVRSNG